MQNDIYQNLPKLGSQYSELHDKQLRAVEMIRNYDVQAKLHVRINQDIPGLRKRKVAWRPDPSNKRLWAPLATFERNGVINVGLGINWVRFCYPLIPLFFFTYMMQPVIHGNIYNMHFANF